MQTGMDVAAAVRQLHILSDLYSALRSAGYAELFESVAPAVLTRIDVIALPERERAVLVKLFTFIDEVDAGDVRAALSPALIAQLVEIGALEEHGERLRSRISIFPHDGLLIVADTTRYTATDFVNGVGPSALTLAGLTVRRTGGATVDLGTGSGVQALLAARHSSQVVAVDVNPRSLAYAEINASLNGNVAIDCRLGSWFEPVEGRRFDLVVANPPFVISPDSYWIFRGSPEAGGLCRSLVRQSPEYLTAGGFAEIMVNWAHDSEDDWREPVVEWLRDLPCDALIVHFGSQDSVHYAANWQQINPLGDPAGYERAINGWASSLHQQGIRRVSSGIVILRRRADESFGWQHTATLSGPVRTAAGGQILRIFAGQDFLHAQPDEGSMLHHAFRPADGLKVEQAMLFRGGYQAEDPAVMLDHAMTVETRIAPQLVHVLFRLDGGRPLGEVVAEAAEETGFDREELTSGSLTMIRDLLGVGLCTPSPDAAKQPEGDGGTAG